jgi:hypothetical protein
MDRRWIFRCGKDGNQGMSADIALGLFLNVLFWAAVVSAAVIVANWWGTRWFPGRGKRARKGIRHPHGQDASAKAAPAEEPKADRYRKAS